MPKSKCQAVKVLEEMISSLFTSCICFLPPLLLLNFLHIAVENNSSCMVSIFLPTKVGKHMLPRSKGGVINLQANSLQLNSYN